MVDGIHKKILKNKSLVENILLNNQKQEFISTGVITLNLLFSGRPDAGIVCGKVNLLAAPSSQGKSFVAFSSLKDAQRKGFFCVVADTERAFDFSFAKQVGIDTSEEKLLVIQSNSIESVQQDIMNLFNGLDQHEKSSVFLVIDSWGGLVTSKTEKNATEKNDAVDFTIPKKKNTLAKLIMGTGCTCLVLAHIMDNTSGFGDPQSITGGRGIYYVSSTIIQGISKAKDKKSASNPEITGSIISCKTVKSRFGKENSKLKFRIKYEGGLDTFYGLLDDAEESGVVISPKAGSYSRPCVKDDKPWKEKDIYTNEFWKPIFKDTDFREFLKNKYTFDGKDIEVANVNLEEDLY